MGLRYRKKIIDGITTIKINNSIVKPQDRLYEKYKDNKEKNISFHNIITYPWRNDEQAVEFTWCDLTNSKLNEDDYYEFDKPQGKGNRVGVNLLERCGLEIAVNGVVLTYGKRIIEDFICAQIQQNAIPFRGRLNFKRELFDLLFKGSNKSDIKVNKDYINSAEIRHIREEVIEKITGVKNKNKNIEESNVQKNAHSNNEIDSFCEKNCYECKFMFTNDRKEIPLFSIDEKNKIIYVNLTSKLSFKEKELCAIITLILNNTNKTWNDICDKFEETYHKFFTLWKRF